MAFALDTVGPFAIRISRGDGEVEQFWQHARESQERIKEMYGIYIFAVKGKRSTYHPWYVGQTRSSFGTRLGSHFRTGKIFGEIRKRCSPEQIEVFLIAVTTHKRGGPAKKTRSRVGWVDFIETALIAHCMVVNPELVNDKKTLLNKKVCVPGFLGDQPEGRDSSAKALASMLNARQRN